MATTRFTPLPYTLSLFLVASLAAAQNGDGGAASGNIPATADGGSAAGAAGRSTGTVALSTGAIVGIVIVVTLICIGGISTAILFFVAKKRQWTVRETLRRSRRRVASGFKTAMSPLTPKRAAFSPGPFKTQFSTRETKGMRGPSPLRKGEKNHGIGFDMDMQALNPDRNRDLEKGEGSRVAVSEKRSGHKPQQPSITIPITGRKIEEPKTPLYSKFFGRE